MFESQQFSVLIMQPPGLKTDLIFRIVSNFLNDLEFFALDEFSSIILDSFLFKNFPNFRELTPTIHLVALRSLRSKICLRSVLS